MPQERESGGALSDNTRKCTLAVIGTFACTSTKQSSGCIGSISTAASVASKDWKPDRRSMTTIAVALWVCFPLLG